MKKNKIFLSIGFFREILHTTLFVYYAILLLPSGFIWPGQNISFILLLAAGHLLIPACYLLLLFDNTKFYSLVQLLRIVKILRILMALLIIVKDLLINRFLLPPMTLYSFDSSVSLILLIILFFDLIFLYFLLSFKEEPETVVLKEQTSVKTVFTETEVRNEIVKE